MPIYECDPWREQYFATVACSPDVHIPTDDSMAFSLNPRHRWIYDKLKVARSQGIECGRHSVPPLHYPVFCKPITNLKGMGVGSRVLRHAEDYRMHCKAGYFWMTLLSGEHISTDWAVVRGQPTWCRHTLGIPRAAGTFDYWVIEASSRPSLEHYSAEWIGRNLPDYTGMLNIETIGGRIIEAHLRFSDQWPDLYGPAWIDAVVRLYTDGIWNFADNLRVESYSVVLFGPHNRKYTHLSRECLVRFQSAPGVSSIQITFLENVAQSLHAMPPGGFRLAVINCFDIEVGLQLRARMAAAFGLPLLQPVRCRAPITKPTRRSERSNTGRTTLDRIP